MICAIANGKQVQAKSRVMGEAAKKAGVFKLVIFVKLS